MAAKYSLRSLLAYFSLGVQRVYLYELINEEPDLVGEVSRHRGLLRADGSRKPAFGALANLLALLADPGGPLQASALSYALQGEIADVQQLLLQKRDGSFQLLLWQEVASWDQAAQQPLVVPDVSVTLVLESAAQTIDVFRPLASSVSEASHVSTAQVLVSVPDHPIVVSIVP